MFWFLKTLVSGGQGHDNNSRVFREIKKPRYFPFLSKKVKVNSLKTILYSKELHLVR